MFVFQTRRSISTESAWQQKQDSIAAEIDTLEDYRKDLRDGWVRYLAAEYSGGRAPVATACKSKGRIVVGDSDEEQ